MATANNVLVLMSDEHTSSVMVAYGNSVVHTPALDKLANEGVRFENAYTPSPICIPARTSFAPGNRGISQKGSRRGAEMQGARREWGG